MKLNRDELRRGARTSSQNRIDLLFNRPVKRVGEREREVKLVLENSPVSFQRLLKWPPLPPLYREPRSPQRALVFSYFNFKGGTFDRDILNTASTLAANTIFLRDSAFHGHNWPAYFSTLLHPLVLDNLFNRRAGPLTSSTSLRKFPGFDYIVSRNPDVIHHSREERDAGGGGGGGGGRSSKNFRTSKK